MVINSLEELYNKTNSNFKLSKEGKLIERFSFDLDDFPLTFRSTLKEDQIKLRYGTKKINRFYIDRKYSYLEKGKMITILNKDHEVIFITNIGASVKFFDKAYKFYLCLNN